MSGPLGAGALQYFSGAKKFYSYEMDQSVRFNDDDNAHFSKLWSSAGNRQTFTYSFWIKRANIGSRMDFISFQQDVPIIFNSDTLRVFLFGADRLITNRQFRDVSAWYHIVLSVDSTDSTSGDRIKLYVNGDRETDFSTESYPSLNANANIYTVGLNQTIGRLYGGSNYFDGYVADMYYLDGVAAHPSSFGETKENIWVAKDYTGSYGTNGFRLSFQDSSSLGDDTSGNGNDFTANNFASTDQMPDNPTNNRAVFNALLKDVKHTTTLSDGNKTISFTSGSEGFSGVPLTIFRDSGQAYCEVNLDRTYSGNSTDSQCVFVISPEQDISAVGSGSLNNKLVGSYCGGGSSDAPAEISSNGVDQGGSPSKYRSANDRVGVYIDFDAGKGFFALNGTVQTVNGTPDIANGTNPHFTFTANSRLTVGVGGVHALTPAILTLKDHPSDWGTTPPSGYTAFATVDLPDPGIDPNANENPTDYFNTVLYTGNGATSHAITGVGFSPNWVWIKKRSGGSASHRLLDTVRGVQKNIYSDASTEEQTQNSIMSFDSDGFTLGDSNGTNQNTHTFVAWNWFLGGSASSNSDGSITSNVLANDEAGLSIVTFTGTGANATVGHGLSSAPKAILIKRRSSSQSWIVYHDGLNSGSTPEDFAIKLNLSDAEFNDASAFNDTAPTSSVFSLGSGGANGSSETHVAYCFAEVDGYSRFGRYVGTGNASNGPFLYMGFRPAWIMVKKADAAENWFMIDIARQPTNDGNIPRLLPNATNTEATDASIAGDFVSNGFQVRATQNMINNDNSEYIYFAFADQPFKYANAK